MLPFRRSFKRDFLFGVLAALGLGFSGSGKARLRLDTDEVLDGGLWKWVVLLVSMSYIIIKYIAGVMSLVLTQPHAENLVVLRFNIPVNSFSVMLGWSHRFLGINQYSRELMSLAQGHNTVTPVGIEPRTSRFYH